MILVFAVLVSFLIGLIRTGGRVGGLSRIHLKSTGLVFAALALQIPLLRSSAKSLQEPFPLASILFLASCPLLLVFIWRNRRIAGSWLLGLGVILNFLAIAANGGFMPISPDTLVRLKPSTLPHQWETGYHRHHSKGIILATSDTLLWELSDIFVLPPPFPLPTAFSIGDVFIAVGIFVLLQKAMGDNSLEGDKDSGAQLKPIAGDDVGATA